MDRVLHVVSVSGGKDSTATLLLALHSHPRESLKFVFADTGNEHEAVYEYLDYLEERLGITIDRLRVNFDARIAAKRRFIARDQRVGRRNGKKLRWSNKAKRRALASLHPSGNAYLDLCLWKGRFPSRRAQFCTQFLKTEPLIRYENLLIDEGYIVVSWQGVRRDESPNRANVLQIEDMGGGLWHYRPIADWTAAQVFEMHFRHGIKPNPLYKQGMSRVGCMPCINANKAEIREIAKRFPGHVERIAEWEKRVCAASKRGGGKLFPEHPSRPDRQARYLGRDRMGKHLTWWSPAGLGKCWAAAGVLIGIWAVRVTTLEKTAVVTRLPPGVTLRICPGCGFLKNQLHVEKSRFNFNCPQCGKHKLSEFLPVNEGGISEVL